MDNGFSIKKACMFLIPMSVLVGIDQLTKFLTLTYLKNGKPIVLISNVLEFTYVENRGAAFGIMYGMKYAFVLLAVVISAAVFYMFLKIPFQKRFLPFDASLICVAAGALGNVIDRLRLGYVVDFIYFMPIDFPVFNFADICVTCAAVLVIILFLFVYKEDDIRHIPFFGAGN